MKKVFSLFLALMLLLTACDFRDDAQKVADYVSSNGDAIVEALESSFSEKGMTCSSTIQAKDCTFIIDMRIQDLEESDWESMQISVDSMQTYFDSSLTLMQQELPQLTGFTFNILDRNGNQLATITAGN